MADECIQYMNLSQGQCVGVSTGDYNRHTVYQRMAVEEGIWLHPGDWPLNAWMNQAYGLTGGGCETFNVDGCRATGYK